MPLPLPTLDRITYDELIAEGRSALPALAPAWTDYNAHDPGITLVELFAWLTESESYRLDQVSESSYRAFLRLSGIAPQASQVSETTLVFEPSGAANVALVTGVQVETADGTVFQTQSPLYVSTAKMIAAVSGTSHCFDDFTIQNRSGVPFRPLGSQPQIGDALYLGFDTVLGPQDAEISLWVFTGNEALDNETRKQLIREHTAVLADTEQCPKSCAEKLRDFRVHYGAQTIWEFYASDDTWQPLKDVVDETRSLTLSGPVRFKSPAPAHAIDGIEVTAYSGLRYIRCRLVQGAYDCPPCIAKISLNAVLARHSEDVPSESFRSNGRAQTTLTLNRKPIVPGSSTVTVKELDKPAENWGEASSFDGYGPLDRIYVLYPETGKIVFGNGRVGRVPPADANVEVNYRVGGSGKGNVHSQQLVHVKDNTLHISVSQPFAAFGGAAAETLSEAKARAVLDLASSDRAVTLEDCESLARTVPGAPIARAHAITDYHPQMNCIPVSGSITIVVLPHCPEQKPEPSPALLATVRQYLDRRRVLTGEMHVVGPNYTTIAVKATLHVLPNADRRATAQLARETLTQFFHPLNGGSNKQGYPIGRAAYRSEVLALLNGLPGVRFVANLSWRIGDDKESQCGNAEICKHGLLISGMHEITIDEGNACHE